MSEQVNRSESDRSSLDTAGAHDPGPTIDQRDAVKLASGRTTWSTEGLDALGLHSILLTDGPHGVRRTTTDAAIIAAQPSTCFPTAAGLAASWDPDLLAEVGAAIGREARALGVSVVLGPGVNIKRHPLGGRNFEYFSEDPLLSGELAAGMIRGIQDAGVGACIKHFAVNNQESRRMVVDAVVDDRALREIYLSGFERAIGAAEPWMVMSAYNRLNGTYCSDARWLLTDILREEWGFDGAVVSDWGGTNDRVAGIRAGLDLEMPGSGGVNDREIARALERGELDRGDFDDVVGRLIALLRRGNRAVPDVITEPAPLPEDVVEEHHELARRAASEACVLLTNDGLLPLEPTGSIAVVGGFATKPRYQGAGSSQVTPTRLDTLLDAVREQVGAGGTVVHAAGYDPETDDPRADLHDEATLVARSADVAIVVVGLPAIYESEGFDRDHLRLPDHHHRLVRSITDVNPNTVVVLANGAPVQLPWVDRPRAILEGYLSGQGGGAGLARVLFGDSEPTGRLAETFALRQTDHGSDAWFPGSDRQVQYRESIHVGYRWFDSVGLPVLFPFGHGLSYTSFEYGSLRLDEGSDVFDVDASPDAVIGVSVDVTNVGERTGAEVVQLYLRRPGSHICRAEQELVGFAKVRLEPGETTTVRLEVDRRAVAHWDSVSGAWQVESGTAELAVGSSSRDIRSTATVDVRSTFVPWSDVDTPTSAADLADDTRFSRLLRRPIPEPDPSAPFHRNSTLDEVATTGIGRGLRSGAVKAAARQFGSLDDLEPVTRKLVDRMMGESPLRAIVLFGGGRLSWRNLDRLIGTMNRTRRFSRR